MIRRILARSCLLITVSLITGFAEAQQQPNKIPRIGVLSESGEPNTPGPQVEAFRRGLQELGYIEGAKFEP